MGLSTLEILDCLIFKVLNKCRRLYIRNVLSLKADAKLPVLPTPPCVYLARESKCSRKYSPGGYLDAGVLDKFLDLMNLEVNGYFFRLRVAQLAELPPAERVDLSLVVEDQGMRLPQSSLSHDRAFEMLDSQGREDHVAVLVDRRLILGDP
jgi:hypothetical protein